MDDDNNSYWEAIWRAPFTMVSNIPQYGLLTHMSLTSLLFHRKWITNTFPVNHIVVHCSSITFYCADIVVKFDSNHDIAVVTYPWNDINSHAYSGIPLHTAMMQQLILLQTDQKNLIDNFVNRVKVALQNTVLIMSHWLLKSALDSWSVLKWFIKWVTRIQPIKGMIQQLNKIPGTWYIDAGHASGQGLTSG